MITYPLNGIEYDASDAQIYHATRTSGVGFGSFDLQTFGNSNTATVKPGLGWIKLGQLAGVAVAQKVPVGINFGSSDPQSDRIDAIAIRFDSSKNETKILLVQGQPGSAAGPKPTRSASMIELILYHIYRKAGSTRVIADDVTDLRGDPAYCGYMLDELTGVDPTLSRPGYVADAAEVGRRLGLLLSIAEFNEVPRVVSVERYTDLDVDGSAPIMRHWSDGYVDYTSNIIYFGEPVGYTDLLGYLKKVDKSYYRGIIPIQIGEATVAPAAYCMGEILTNGMGRTTCTLRGEDAVYVGMLTEGSWSGWKKYVPTEAAVLLPEALPVEARVEDDGPVELPPDFHPEKK